MKHYFYSILFTIIISNVHVLNSQQKPNVIIIYTDDQGSIDLNSFGANDLRTPNLDRIVNSGVKFTQFYGSPICSPSRASLLTGKTPQKAGVPGNVDPKPSKIINGLSGNQYTMAEMFRDANYKTAHIGKWHLGTQKGMLPNEQGFDYSFGHYVGCIDNYSHFFYWNGPNRHDLYRNGKEVFYDGDFFPDLMVTETIKFIETNKDNSFFLYFATNMPHYPYQGDQKWLKYYHDKNLSYPRILYNAFLSTLDDKIGTLMDKLEEFNLLENTIIVFQSDNGHSTEERAHFGGGDSGVFRGAKQCLFEGGIRVPAAISWKNKIPKGEIRDQFAVNTDWMPTLAELCDIKFDTTNIDGKSLVPIINNSKHNTLHTGGYCWKLNEMWVARKGNWKLIGNPYDSSNKQFVFNSNRWLVNLENDQAEQINLADKYPNIVFELENQYQKWLMNQ